MSYSVKILGISYKCWTESTRGLRLDSSDHRHHGVRHTFLSFVRLCADVICVVRGWHVQVL